MWLFLTNRCNLTCSYCYVHQDGRDMEPATAFKAVDYFLSSDSSHKEQKIIFFGGEPLLRSNLIAPVVAHAGESAKKFKKKVVFWLYTNGTTINQHIVKQLLSLGVRVSISFDGVRECHQNERLFKNGGSSLAKTVENTPVLLASYPDTMVNASITPGNVRYLSENIVFFRTLGFKRIFFQTITSAPWTDEDISIYLEELGKSFEYYYHETVIGKETFYLSLFEDYLNNLEKRKSRKRTSCGAGLVNMAVSVSGEIFPCHRFATLEYDPGFKGKKNEYLLGDVFSGLSNWELIDFLLSAEQEETDGCGGCPVRGVCVNFCHWRDYLKHGRFGTLDTDSCELQKRVNEKIHGLIERFPEIRGGMRTEEK